MTLKKKSMVVFLLSLIACELGVLIYILARDPKTIVVETDPGIRAEMPKQEYKQSVPYGKTKVEKLNEMH